MENIYIDKDTILDIHNYAPNMEIRNARYKGPIESEKYNMSMNELYHNLKVLEKRLNRNEEKIYTDIVNIIEENNRLIRHISYLMKKYDFIKQYRFKGE